MMTKPVARVHRRDRRCRRAAQANQARFKIHGRAARPSGATARMSSSR